MKKITILLGPIFILLIGGLVFQVDAGNACITCHQALGPSVERAHNFDEWEQSVHARKGINCEKCHGGNPNESDPQKAHQGILKSNQPKSPLYFSNIPETCGQCHASELEQFKKSYHYRELKRSGHGPNCITCHGSMAISIPKPKQLEQNCSLCHAQRQIASEALVTLNLAGSSLEIWEKTLQEAKEAGVAGAEQEKGLLAQKKAYAEVQRKWHSFNLTEVVEKSREIVGVAKQGTQDLRLKKGVK